jgi:glycosyltransferase involved in cell wall biosynthesis
MSPYSALNQKNNALVSVIMPIYNTEEYLSAAIESVLSQTYSNWELLILNDESPGNARDIAAKFTDSRIRYFEHRNSGPSATRNRGLMEGLGEYFAFLDSDDIWYPDKLEKQIDVMEKNPEVGVVYSQRETINEFGEKVKGYQPKLHEGMILNKLWIDNFVCMSSAVISRNVLAEIGFLDETLWMSEDFDYWLRVACKMPFTFVNEPLVKYRLHCNQVSNKTEMRFNVVLDIRRRFETEHAGELSFSARRLQKAYMLCNKASRNEGRLSHRVVLADYLKSLFWFPLYISSWRGIVRILLPHFLIDFYRKLKARYN